MGESTTTTPTTSPPLSPPPPPSTSDENNVNGSSSPSKVVNNVWQSWPPEALTMARTALELTRQDWSLTGQSTSNYKHPTLLDMGNAKGRTDIVNKMVSLLFIRIVALVTRRLGNTVPGTGYPSPEETAAGITGDGKDRPKRQKIYMDYSTTTICKAALQLFPPVLPQVPQVAPATTNNPTNIKKQQLKKEEETEDSSSSLSDEEEIIEIDDKGYHSEPSTKKDLLMKKQQQQKHLNNKTNKTKSKKKNTTLRRASADPPSPPSRTDLYGNGGGGKSSSSNNNNILPPSKKNACPSLYPTSITPRVISQLKHYVTTICQQYHTPENVPYHNVEHAYHVFLSANKLLDLMLCESPEEGMMETIGESSSSGGGGGGEQRNSIMNGSSGGMDTITNQMKNLSSGTSSSGGKSSSTMAIIKRRSRRSSVDSQTSAVSTTSSTSAYSTGTRQVQRPTFGLKSDPLSQLAFLFSALVHDVDHTGISNRQLVLESDDLAILYNDQSVAEQRSLAVAFTTLKRDGGGGSSGNDDDDGEGDKGGYKELRNVLFPEQSESVTTSTTPATAGGTGNEDFFKFRKLVIDLVLVTDIASPERTQIVKSKWKEAFGDVVVEKKLKKSATHHAQQQQQQQQQRHNNNKGNSGGGRGREYYRVDRNKIQSLDPSNSNEMDEDDNGSSGGGGSGGPTSKLLVPTRRQRKYENRSGSSGSLESDDRGEGEKGEGTPPKNNRSSTSNNESQRPPTSSKTIINNTNNNNSERQNQRIYSSSLISTTDSNCDSIYFDSSSSSSDSDVDDESLLSASMNSLEDDFDASAVSRSKMNFDNALFDASSNSNTSLNSSGGGVGGGSGGKSNRSGKGGRRGRQGGDETTTSSSTSGGTTGNVNPLSQRWSTGDLTDDLPEDTGDDDNNQQQEDVPRPLPNNASSSPRGRVGASSSNRSNQQARGSRPGMSKSFSATSSQSSGGGGSPNHRRRRSSTARVGGLSQSLVSHNDLRRARPRAHSEERRLGVRRALDLAGSTIIAYNTSLRGSAGSVDGPNFGDNAIGSTIEHGGCEDDFDPDDDEDEFKATVVLEQMIRAADVAALLQDWDNSMKWSTRLYKELKNGYILNRGEDPSVGWYENQIKFFDFYILPLAKNLGVMGVFEESVGSMFVHCVKSNLARWIEEGSRATELMMKEDEKERSRPKT